MNRALVDAVEEAATAALAAITAEHPGERLLGFALCTDDDMWTLYAAATTLEALANPGERFMPVDWPYEQSVQFDRAAALLKNRPAGSDYRVYFQSLTKALSRMRAKAMFDPDTFLIALSTDPGARQRRLAREALLELNSQAIAEAALRVLTL